MKSDDARQRTARQGEDRILVYGVSDGGRTAHVVRKRGDDIEAGQLRPVESGKAVTGDVVSLRPRKEFPLLFDVDVQIESPLRVRRHKDHAGPAQVATAAYRHGWDAIWGSSPALVEAPAEPAPDSVDDEDVDVLPN